jgi:4-hydroxy-3-polyprenylbenzoate decarboxylase
VIKEECEKEGIRDFNILGESNLNRLCICSVGNRSPKRAAEAGKELLDSPAGRMANIILMVDEDVDLKDLSIVTWKFFNNTDPKRDILVCEGGLVIDATKKGPGDRHDREWPDDIVMDDDTKKRVDILWPKLGIGA